VLVAIAAAGLVVLPSILAGNQHPRVVGIVGEVSPTLRSTFAATAPAFDTRVRLESFPDEAAGERAVRSGDVDVLVVGGEELVWKGEPDTQLAGLVTAAVQAAHREEAIAELGLTPEQAATLLAPQPLRSSSLEPVKKDEAARAGLATVALVLLFATISVYGGLLVTGVIEEKANRVVEVLLSRLRAYELLAGKVLGIGLVGLAQLLVVGAAVLAALLTVGTADLPKTTPGMIGWVLFWFVLGYAFYSVVYATTGAMASRQEDAQAVSLPLTMLLIAAYLVSFVAVEDPEGLVARICSFLPPTAPLVMTVREAHGNVALWEVLVSAAIMVVSIYGLLRLGGRLYAGAILRVGPRVRFRDAWRSAEG
jgi:ABC-2 type transport system permease protein